MTEYLIQYNYPEGLYEWWSENFALDPLDFDEYYDWLEWLPKSLLNVDLIVDIDEDKYGGDESAIYNYICNIFPGREIEQYSPMDYYIDVIVNPQDHIYEPRHMTLENLPEDFFEED